VIGPNQVWAGVLSNGVLGNAMNSNFQNRESSSYKTDLGRTMVNIARLIPGGLLVFFPSYPALESAITSWKTKSVSSTSTDLFHTLSQVKPIFVEPRNSNELKEVIHDFENQIVLNPAQGAILFAVCRGKVSEGLDFADSKARAVIVTGIPFAPAYDPKVFKLREERKKKKKKKKKIKETYAFIKFKKKNFKSPFFYCMLLVVV
jgi:regulator of telomere elongation helicase 1